MRKIILSMCTLLFVACQSETGKEQIDNKRKDIELTTREEMMVQNGNSFAFNLFKQVNSTITEKNFLVSPLSASQALAMSCNGAAGLTADEMKTALDLKEYSQEEMNNYYRKITDGLLGADKLTEFSIANSIWVNNNFSLLPSFISVNQKMYDAEVRNLDFSSTDALGIINKWCADKTNNRIKEIIEEINPRQCLFLINALYFKGAWQQKFDKKNTVQENFTNSDQTVSNVDMMQDMTYTAAGYCSTSDMAMAEFPYGNGAFSMVVILPWETSSTDAIIEQLSPENWKSWTERLSPRTLFVKFPKFKNESTLDLIPVLSKMGINVPFTPMADFTKTSATADLYINIVKQKTFIKVDEEGSEAAAVTIIGGLDSAGPGGDAPTTIFHINRSFIYLIKEKSTGAILFMGKIDKI